MCPRRGLGHRSSLDSEPSNVATRPSRPSYVCLGLAVAAGRYYGVRCPERNERHARSRAPALGPLAQVVLAMSDEDAGVLAAWVRSGGVLVAVDWPQTAIYDEDFRPRPKTAASLLGGSRCAVLQALRTHAGAGEVRTLDKQLHRYAFQGYHDAADDAAIAAAVEVVQNKPAIRCSLFQITTKQEQK